MQPNKNVHNVKNLITRILSGAIFVAIVSFSIYFIPVSPAIFLVVFGAFTVLAMWEMNHLTSEGDVRAPLLSLIDIFGGIAVFLAFFLMYAGDESRSSWLMPVVLYFIIRLAAQLWMPSVNAIHSLQRSLFNVAYVGLPLGLTCTVVALGGNAMLLLALFIILWLNDSGAYIFGSLLGRHRLFERVSPHKSWEGFIGGVAVSVAAAAAMGQWFNPLFGPMTLGQWIGFGLVVSLGGTIGDLVESLMKRTAGVKDMSELIPGHGGLLDRIDSLMLAVPAAVAYLIVLKQYFW